MKGYKYEQARVVQNDNERQNRRPKDTETTNRVVGTEKRVYRISLDVAPAAMGLLSLWKTIKVSCTHVRQRSGHADRQGMSNVTVCRRSQGASRSEDLCSVELDTTVAEAYVVRCCT